MADEEHPGRRNSKGEGLRHRRMSLEIEVNKNAG